MEPIQDCEIHEQTEIHKQNELSIVDRLHIFVQSVPNERIVLLRDKNVIRWLFGEHSFFPAIQKKNKTTDTKEYKKLEDEWGKEVLKTRRVDLSLEGQWTNMFGEHICQEIFMLKGKTVTKPNKMQNYQPDIEVDDNIIEVKTGTYYTTGTASEKILGCPFKYAEIPSLYNKPLLIVCIGGAEKICKEQYGNLPGPKCSPIKKIFIDFFKQNNIEYIGITDLLISILNNS